MLTPGLYDTFPAHPETFPGQIGSERLEPYFLGSKYGRTLTENIRSTYGRRRTECVRPPCLKYVYVYME